MSDLRMDAADGEALRDPIEMEVFTNRLLSITEDMNNTLVRSSFSTNIKERKDCSVALFDARGRLVTQGTQIPLHLGSLFGAMEAVLAQYPADTIADGDAFVCNDPYLAGGTHLPDINVITPVFHDGRLAFFTANVGHHADVGGSVPGSVAGNLRSVFEEGIRIPVVRIARNGAPDEEVLRLVCANTRDPEERSLDLKVQIATNQRGAAAVRGLLEQMGGARAVAAVDDVIRYTRSRLARRIAQLAPGSSAFACAMDDDGMPGAGPVEIRVTVTVADGRLHFDFSGSSGQARGALNMPMSALRASVFYSVKALLDPELSVNSGMFDLITIEAPAGTIVNPLPPAAVGARSITAQKVAGAIFGAFRGVLPRDRVMASSNDVCPAIVFSGRLERRLGDFVYLETVGGGAGAHADADGMDGIHVHMTNTSNLPIEALENEYPLQVVEYAYVPDSGGVGQARGGMGLAREIRVLVDGIVFSARSDNHTVGRAEGAFGGGDGRQARLLKRDAAGHVEVLSSKTAALRLARGDSVRLETSGAGGFGDPALRPVTAIVRDLANGCTTEAAAREAYGARAAEAIETLKRSAGS